jgi:predicted HTH transcriptional regulator
MINKAWNRITAQDLQQLVDDQIPESNTLDYKEETPDESPKSKLDFLSDVGAFANASGGDLIFGIREKREAGKPTAIPERFVKLRMRGTLDETKRRLESLIRSVLVLHFPYKLVILKVFLRAR